MKALLSLLITFAVLAGVCITLSLIFISPILETATVIFIAIAIVSFGAALVFAVWDHNETARL